jgi:glycosyltransferase involved in cell wall biosynthesis
VSVKPVRTLWLTKGLGRGGAERLLSLSVVHIDRDRYDVEVAYTLPWKDAWAEEIRSQGIPVHCLGSPDPRLAWPARLRLLARRRGYRLVHTHSPVPAVAARLALPRSTALVHTEHNVWGRYRWPTRVANTATFGRNRAVLAVSRGVADSVRRPFWMPARVMPAVEVLYHGIDEQHVCSGPEARAAARRLLGIGGDALVIGSVANFTPKKNQHHLLRAMKLLDAVVPDVKLVLVGTGPLEQSLRHDARQLGIGDRVLFTGSREDVQELLPAFDAFALSSRHEGLSIALLEAMAAGVPCVSTRVGGVPELVCDGQEGLLVAPGDPEALARAIGTLLQDAALRSRMGRAGTETAGRFSIGSAVRRMEEVYETVLGRSSAGRVDPSAALGGQLSAVRPASSSPRARTRPRGDR